MQTIILSDSVHETYAWADAKGRHRRSVRHVPHAASLQGRAYDGIVELPSFAKRRDRHAVLAMLKKLRRSLPNIPYELEEDWVIPPRKPTPAERAQITRATALLGDVGEPVHNMTLAELAQERADIDAYFEEGDPAPGGQERVNETSTEEIIIQAAGTVEHVQEILDEAREPTPKKRGRRTNEQKAYDDAFAAHEQDPSDATANDLAEARTALRKRHPEDPRLTELADDDLDF